MTKTWLETFELVRFLYFFCRKPFSLPLKATHSRSFQTELEMFSPGFRTLSFHAPLIDKTARQRNSAVVFAVYCCDGGGN